MVEMYYCVRDSLDRTTKYVWQKGMVQPVARMVAGLAKYATELQGVRAIWATCVSLCHGAEAKRGEQDVLGKAQWQREKAGSGAER